MELIRSKFTYEYVSNSIERGVIEDINAVFPVLGGLTLLHMATLNNDQKLVDYLLRKGADINSKSQRWGTVFNFAVIMNNLTTIQSLISFGADVSNINHQIEFSELSRFKEAVQQYYKEIPEFFLPFSACLSTISCSSHSAVATLPLNIAIFGTNDKMVELLLKNNADPNPDADTYGSPLMFAIIKRNLPIIKLLLAYGSDVNFVKRDGGESPLHKVILMHNSEAVKLFLNHDMIDVHILTDCKESALHYGIKYMANDDVIRQLLNAGIDFNLKNSGGETAFSIRRRNNSKKVDDAITEHIAKCSAANFYVSEENLAVANSGKFGELRDQCLVEIEKMKITFVGTTVSLKYVSDSTISNLDIESIFPLYGGMMTYRLKKALRRKKLLFNAMDLTNDILQELKLPMERREIGARSSSFAFLAQVYVKTLGQESGQIVVTDWPKSAASLDKES
ncbi:putative ankyrin repeat protein RF_0381 [Microplitis mediator]|uniref:putative ankyrin repeat protein RF_0381 n=1 Tax=Microplitis mediator TaxID=375433 RepID=UPI0025563034|nr:putative ankyrin repeat protein RF_0381 [Microplitis mediator]